MLGSDRIYLALSLLSTVVVGCGGGTDTAGTGGSGGLAASTSVSVSSSSSSVSSSDASSSSTGGLTCAPGEGKAFAVTKLSFGEGTSGEWKKVGLNLDGLVSTGASKDVCQPNAGGTAGTAYPDGDEGIDNSFGKNLLPTLISLDQTWSTDVNNSIHNGFFDVLLKLYCLPPSGDVPEFTTKLFGGTGLGMKPKFDGTDKWPVSPELLSDPTDPESSAILFEKSSVIGTTFNSGKNGTFILTIPVTIQKKNASIKLTLYSGTATMTLSADRKSATGGTIAGVLNTEEFVAEVKKIGILLDLCDSSIFDNVITAVRQASDIMADGTQDPSKTCDGISMGLQFEMVEALIGDVGPAAPVGMACP